MRENHEEVVSQSTLFKNSDDSSSADPREEFVDDESRQHRQGARVEFLPVEWHEAFQRMSRGNDASLPGAGLNDIALQTIPHLRNFCNDAMLDVLYFMSPDHHDMIIELVTRELNLVVQKFKKIKGRDFTGKVSIIGHSLGSIITWDILANQRGEDWAGEDSSRASSSQSQVPRRVGILSSLFGTPTPPPTSPLSSSSSAAAAASSRTHGGEQKDYYFPKYPQLNFEVLNSFMLGSPIAVFLLLRAEPIERDYKLPGCKRTFNIFHKYDPAAYRIEPLINRRNANHEPCILPAFGWKGGFRVQYQTKMLWRRFTSMVWKTQRNIFASIESGIANIGLLDVSVDEADASVDEADAGNASFARTGGGVEDNSSKEGSSHTEDDSTNESVVESDDEGFMRGGKLDCGNLCGGCRVDYVLQEKEIENANEYIFALGAHSGYWKEKDLSFFIAREILRGTVYYNSKSPVKKVYGGSRARQREQFARHQEELKQQFNRANVAMHSTPTRGGGSADPYSRGRTEQLPFHAVESRKQPQQEEAPVKKMSLTPRTRFLHTKTQQLEEEKKQSDSRFAQQGATAKQAKATSPRHASRSITQDEADE